jgi:hypothetical protein
MLFSNRESFWLALMLAVASLSAFGCSHRAEPRNIDSEAAADIEPESYSATIVRTIDDGLSRREIITRIVRSGEMRREEWSDQGKSRALISRPDMGKAFLLDLDKQAYVESALAPASENEIEADSSNANRSQSNNRSKSNNRARTNNRSQLNASAGESNEQPAISPGDIERVFSDAPLPSSVEMLALPDQTIENHLCRVFERRASFPGGHTEITRVFRAVDLQGLAIRIESESEGGVKLITERREAQIAVSPDEFIIPSGFKKVGRLDH